VFYLAELQVRITVQFKFSELCWKCASRKRTQALRRRRHRKREAELSA